MSCGGIALITLSQNTGFHIDLWAILILTAAIAQSLYSVGQKPLLTRYTAFECTAYAIWSGTIFLLIFSPGLVSDIQHSSFECNICGDLFRHLPRCSRLCQLGLCTFAPPSIYRCQFPLSCADCGNWDCLGLVRRSARNSCALRRSLRPCWCHSRQYTRTKRHALAISFMFIRTHLAEPLAAVICTLRRTARLVTAKLWQFSHCHAFSLQRLEYSPFSLKKHH